MFDSLGTDMFIVCTPGRNTLFVANAEATSQIVTRRNDFPKPLEMYGSINIFGTNVVTTEGQLWRHHRKITSPPFTEANNHSVWHESLHQGRAMVAGWRGTDGNQNSTPTIEDVQVATMRLSLHVISKAGFGVRLLWPHEELEQYGRILPPPEGHSLTYKDALSNLLENIIPVMLLPRWFLSRSPFKGIQEANESFVEWGKYMREMYERKKSDVKAGEVREGIDLMGALVNGAGITADSSESGDVKKSGTSKQMLSDDEILGNAFVFILAGHETAANTIHFSMLYLAMNWQSQARLQKDLDEIFSDRTVSAWDYDRDVPKLFGTMVGAVMNEVLRLIPPVVGIPKSTASGSPQPMTVDGKRVVVPADSHVTLDAPASHRNPRYWPTMSGPNASPTQIEKDLDSFKPERWLLDPSKTRTNPILNDNSDHLQEADSDSFGGPSGRDTSTTLFRPQRGAYIPFSEGARSCIGRRFAQIEVLAVLAVIFREYSVELALDEYASDEEIAAMGEDAKRETWTRAKDKAEYLLKHGMGTIITIQMRGGKVPMRFVKRGAERFKYD